MLIFRLSFNVCNSGWSWTNTLQDDALLSLLCCRSVVALIFGNPGCISCISISLGFGFCYPPAWHSFEALEQSDEPVQIPQVCVSVAFIFYSPVPENFSSCCFPMLIS